MPLSHRDPSRAAQIPLLAELAQAAPDGLVLLDAAGGVLAANAAARRILGGEPVSLAAAPVPEELLEQLRAAHRAALGGEPVEFLAPGTQASVQLYRHEMRLLQGCGGGDGVVWILRDVTLAAAQAQTLGVLQHRLDRALQSETLLARELHHRVRNLFSVITGLISVSQRNAPEGEAPRESLERLKQRILSMARAADLLMPSEESEKPLINPDPTAISQAVLEPFGDLFRVSGAGPEVSTPMFSTIVLVLHEMASNSLEHGILCKKSGVIDLNWRDEGSHSRLIWREDGASEVAGEAAEARTLLRSIIAASSSEMHVNAAKHGLEAEFRFRNDWS